MEFYVTERDRELACEWILPYSQTIAESKLAVERLAERIAIVRQEERQTIKERINLFCARAPLCSTQLR